MRNVRRWRVLSALLLVIATATAVFLPGIAASAAAAAAFSPSPYSYGKVPAGQTAVKTFTLTNSGSSATQALTITLTPASGTPSGAFTKTADTCTATSLGPKKSCTVTVRFAPATAGSFSATLTAINNKKAVQATDALSGTGVNTVTVTNPGNQTSTVGDAVNLQIQASDSASGQTLTYSATGLPAGLSINASTGLISGTPTTPGSLNSVVTAKDSTGASGSASFTWTVSPAPLNPPVISNVETTALAYQAGSPPVAVTSTLTISDPSDATISGGTVSITAGFDSGADTLGFATQNGITGSYDASTGVLTLTGSASVADYQAALRSVTFATTDTSASPAQRTVSFVVTDTNNQTSNTASRVVSVSQPVVTPPVISNVETTALAYQAGSPPVAVTSTLTISDSDDATLSGGAVSITAGFDSGADTLGFTTQNGITGSYDASTGVLTLTGNASVADYQAALRSVTFATTDTSASPAQRTVSFVVTDTNNQTSNTASRPISVTAAAAAPPTANQQSYTAVGNTSLAVGTTATGPAATVPAGAGLLNGDSGDASCGTLTVTGHTAPAHGTLPTLNTDGTFTYLPAAGFTGTDTFNYTITCGTSGQTASNSVTITVSTLVWYVNNTAAPGGNGESSSPFSTLAAVGTAAGTNSIIFLYQGSGSYAGGLTMKSSQGLVGQPHGLTISGYTLVAAGGSNPVITNSSGDGIDLAAGDLVEDVTVSAPGGDGINGTGVSGTIAITNDTITGSTGDGILIVPASGSTTTLAINDNSIQTQAFVYGIDVDPGGDTTLTGSLSGIISGNTIGSPTVAGSGAGTGINVQAEGSFTSTVEISNNHIYQYQNDSGINFETDKGSPTLNLNIIGNTIAHPGEFGSWGILGDAGAETGDAGTVCVAMSLNSITGAAAVGQGGADFELDQMFNTTIELPGYTGASSNTNAVVTFVQGNNTSGGTPSGIATASGSGGGFTGGDSCPAP